MLRSEQVMKVSMQITPQSPPYQIEAARQMYANMKVSNIDKLLPPPIPVPQPVDPVSENMALMTGKPVQAFIQQNHQAHIAIHQPIAEANPAAQAHIAEHQAFAYRLLVENTLGFQLPQEGAPIDPQIQEQIAMLVAKATQIYMDEQKAKNPPPPSMEMIMMEDVNQKKQKAALQYKETLAKIDADAKLQNQKSDDAAAGRSAELEKVKLKTMADMISKEPTGETPQEKIAHINAEAAISVARIKTQSTDGSAEYDYEKKKGE
jgi:hypothetical protein